METGMRGRFVDQGGLFSYISPDKRVPANYPLRKVRELVRDVLRELSGSLANPYASEGRPSIPPDSKKYQTESRNPDEMILGCLMQIGKILGTAARLDHPRIGKGFFQRRTTARIRRLSIRRLRRGLA